MTRKFLMTVAIVAIALAPSIGIGTAQANGFGGGFHGGGIHGGGIHGGGFHGGGFYGGGFGGRGFYGGYGRGFLRWLSWFLSGLLWIRLFPILLLLLLIGYSWRPGTAQGWSEAKIRPTGALAI